MFFLVGIYLVVGVFKTLGRFGKPPAEKPLWMTTERNGITIAVLSTLYTLFWPFIKS